MRYRTFRIRNFKGVKDATVNFSSIGGANVFAFVGLNESGKTTVLEAIHSFSPDAATGELLGGDEGLGVPFKRRVPRHLISTFTGDVSVIAEIEINEADREKITSLALNNLGIKIDPSSLGSVIVFERNQRFKDGDFKASYFSLRTSLSIKTGKQKNWRVPDSTESVKLRDLIFR